MKDYIATFHTHYGALVFFKECKKLGVVSEQKPVPRKLSSSCGTCVAFKADSHNFLYGIEDVQEDFEACYLDLGANEYRKMSKD